VVGGGVKAGGKQTYGALKLLFGFSLVVYGKILNLS
jgi:hypothetical protein